nr:MAG TPA: tape measure protein [Caudoviricetes sp.]
MADENSFVQKVSFRVDDSEVERAFGKIERRLADLRRSARLNISAGFERGLSGFAGGVSRASGGTAVSAIVLKEQRHAAKSASALAVALDTASRSVELFSLRLAKLRVPSSGVAATVAAQGGVARAGGMATLGSMVPGIVGGALSIGALKSFASGSISAYNVQKRAETSARQILANSGMGEDVFRGIRDRAGDLQGRTIYGDEAMIAGAAELSTYVKDPELLKRMMGTLADYAAGMTGNTELDSRQMTDLATGLGKAMFGAYDSLRMKGFDVDELKALDEREKKGGSVTDAERLAALERAIADYRGMAEAFAKTDEGKIIQTKNAVGDLREEVGRRLQPVMANLAEKISERMPQLERVFLSFGKAAGNLVDALADHAGAIGNTIEAFARLLELLTRMPVAVGGFAVALKALRANGGMAADAKSLAGALDGLKGSLSGLARAGMWGAIAWGIGQVLELGDAAVELYRQKGKERDMRQNLAAGEAYRTTLNDRRKKWKDAMKLAADAYGKDPNATRMVSEAFAEYRAAAEKVRDGGHSGLSAEIMKELGWAERPAPEREAAAGAKNARPVINIRQTNNISTSFDDFGRLVKENIRALAESALTIRAGSDIMKGAAV